MTTYSPLRTQLNAVINQCPGPVLQDYYLCLKITPFRSVPHPVTRRNKKFPDLVSQDY